MRKRHSLFTFLLAGLLLVAFSLNPVYAQTGENLLSLLQDRDRRILAGVTAAVDLLTPAHPLGVDSSARRSACVLTADGESRGVACAISYLTPPSYRGRAGAEARAFDYDTDGNLVVWRSLRKYGLSTPDLEASYEEFQMLAVMPAGRVSEEGRQVQLQYYPVTSGDGTFEFDRSLMALGRGFALQLDAITEIRRQGSGLLQVAARGSAPGSALQGTWMLMIDPAADYLVRDALFIPEDERQAALVANASGTVRSDGLTIANRGTLRLTVQSGLDYTYSVQLTSVAPRSDGGLLARALDSVTGPLPEGSEVVDFRVDPPTRTYERIPVFEPNPIIACCDCHPVNMEIAECGHISGFEALGCSSDWCIVNWLISATCVPHDVPPPPACRIEKLKTWEVLQTPYRRWPTDPHPWCPTGGDDVAYAPWVRLYDICTAACVPATPHGWDVACVWGGGVAPCRNGRMVPDLQGRRGVGRRCL